MSRTCAERELALEIYGRGAAASMSDARKQAREQLQRMADKRTLANINKPEPVALEPAKPK